MSDASRTLGDLVRGWRMARGYTLRDLERKGVASNSYLSQLETGRIKQPSYTVLVELEKALDMPQGAFLTWAGYKLLVPPGDAELTEIANVLYRTLSNLVTAIEKSPYSTPGYFLGVGEALEWSHEFLLKYSNMSGISIPKSG